MLRKKSKKIATILENLNLIPRRIYIIAFIAGLSAFVTVGAEYGFAVLLQVYGGILGFISQEQITPFLQPLTNYVFWPIALIVLVVLFRGLSLFIQSYINIAFHETFVYETRKRLLYSLFKPNSRWHYDLGTTSNIMAEIIPKGAQFITSLARFLVLSVQVFGLGFLCLLSLPKEFSLSLAIFVLMAPVIIYLNRKSRGYGRRILERSQQLNIQLMKSVKNFIFIKILGLEESERDKTQVLAKDYYQNFMSTNRYYALANVIPTTFGMIVVILMFYFFNMGGTTEASLLTLFYLLLRFIQNLSQAVGVTNGMSIYYPNFQSTMEILRRNREEEEEERKKEASLILRGKSKLPTDLTLTVRDLSFSYVIGETKKMVFDKISFQLRPGELFVVKGSSGSGKSTLLMNLINVLELTSGSISWGGLELSHLDLNNFKKVVGYMGPEPYIISGTVYDNLSYGLHDKPSKEEMIEACKLAEVYDFLKQMPKGFEAVLTEQGEGLSMGQKQRLGLARALLRKPKILVLDEITANLDQETERSVINNIQKLKPNMIILTATHSTAFDSIADITINL